MNRVLLHACCTGLLTLATGCATRQERLAVEGFERLETAAQQASHRATILRVDAPAASPAALLAELPQSPSLEDYTAFATLHNADLQAQFQRWRSALERIPQARTLPDPRLNYRYFIENVETRVGPQQQAFGLSQTFPWFGELGLKGEMAVQAARAAQAHFEQKRLMLTYQVVRAYCEYAYQATVIRIVRENRDLVQHMEEVARSSFRAGAQNSPSIIRAQVELGRLEDRLRSAQAMELPLRAELNALLGRSVHAPTPGLVLPETVTHTFHADQLRTQLQANNPELRALRHEAARARQGIALAKTDSKPDFTLGVDYIDVGNSSFSAAPDEGNDAVAVGVSVNLPIWKERNDAVVADALARFGTATHRQADRQHNLAAELELAIFRYEDALRKLNLYQNTLLPKAQESLASTLTAFRGDTATFTDLIDAQRVLLEFQLQVTRAQADKTIRLAQIEMLAGTTMQSWEESTP